MKLLQLTQTLILILTVTSCAQSDKKNKTNQTQNSLEYNGKTYTLKKGINLSANQPMKKEQDKIIFQIVRDQQRNMVLGYLPLPENWKMNKSINKEQVIISGPNNIKVYSPQMNSFTYSELPGMNQMSTEAGQQVKPLKSVERFVKEELEPALSSGGVKLIRQYHIPELQAYDENYDQFTFKSVPMRKEFKAYATEWKDNKGSSLFFIIRYSVSYTQTGIYWGYYVNIMDAPNAYFEKAKKDYLYALNHAKYNPKWLQACYMEEAHKAQQRGEVHAQRMAALRAEGQAIIERGKAHSAMVDRNHKKFMDSHLERQTVSTSSTNYQVDAGSNVYWVNSNGEYIPTNDFNFDPNLDPNLNGQTWTKTTNNN